MKIFLRDSDDGSLLMVKISSIRYHRASSTAILYEEGNSHWYRLPGLPEQEYNKLLEQFFEKEKLDLRAYEVVKMGIK